MRAVLLPAGLCLLTLVALIGTVLDITTTRSDALALGRQNNLVSTAIRQSIVSIANDQEASTLWDDAVVKLHQRPLDRDWIDNNLGIWFHTYYQHDETYLIDPRDRILYGMVAGRRTAPGAFREIAREATPLVAALRSQLLSGSAASQGSRGQTKGIVEFAIVRGHPSIISLKPIVPETDSVLQAPGQEFLHVSVRYLDGTFLASLQSRYRIDNPRFTTGPDSVAHVGLRDRSGDRIGYISWDPFRPGAQVAQGMLPAFLGALLLIGVTLVLLLLQHRRNRLHLMESNRAIEHLAFHDALTDLPNRAAFRIRLESLLGGPQDKTNVAVLLLDLDRFKLINDAFGHQAGDAVIRTFSERLSALVHAPNLVARLGGDEFAVILQEEADVDGLCEAILGAVRKPCEFDGQELHIGVSIGIAFAGYGPCDAEELLRKADIALYRSKADGRNCFRLFDNGMDEQIRVRTTIENELRAAMQCDDELSLFLQPILSPHSYRPVGFEALLRWYRDDQLAWPADQFVPVAEECGLIVPLGEWAMRKACEASLRLDGPFVAVNLSPLQCRSPAFIDTLLGIVRDSGADPSRLQIEITEKTLLEGRENALAAVSKLRAAGLKVVLEDFGIGYSSLRHLSSMRFDKLKLDRSLVHHLGQEPKASEFVAAVLGLGKVVGLTMAAEGVESVEQRDLLVAAGCLEMQGHYFSPAIPIEAALRMIPSKVSKSAA